MASRCKPYVLCVLQDVIPSEALATHSALVNADLCRELVSLTQQMEEQKLRHRLVNVCQSFQSVVLR